MIEGQFQSQWLHLDVLQIREKCMEPLQIVLLGNVSVLHPLTSMHLKLSHGPQLLLAYLLLQRRLTSREVLLEAFWGDHPPDRARQRLNTVVWRLRQALEPKDVTPQTYLITTSAGEIGFNWECHYWLDIESFGHLTHALLRKPVSDLGENDIAQIERCLALYRGDLLECVYEDWALRERERFRTLYLNCLARLMEYYTSQRSFERGAYYGQEILRRDPVREEIHRALMRIYADGGQRTLALEQYRKCCEILARDLEIAPLEETQALYYEIKSAPQRIDAYNRDRQQPEVADLFHELEAAWRAVDDAVKALARIQAIAETLVRS